MEDEYHTVKSLRDLFNELIEKGYGDYEVMITYDNGYGVVSAHKDVSPKIKKTHFGNHVIFAEDNEMVMGFDL